MKKTPTPSVKFMAFSVYDPAFFMSLLSHRWRRPLYPCWLLNWKSDLYPKISELLPQLTTTYIWQQLLVFKGMSLFRIYPLNPFWTQMLQILFRPDHLYHLHNRYAFFPWVSMPCRIPELSSNCEIIDRQTRFARFGFRMTFESISYITTTHICPMVSELGLVWIRMEFLYSTI